MSEQLTTITMIKTIKVSNKGDKTVDVAINTDMVYMIEEMTTSASGGCEIKMFLGATYTTGNNIDDVVRFLNGGKDNIIMFDMDSRFNRRVGVNRKYISSVEPGQDDTYSVLKLVYGDLFRLSNSFLDVLAKLGV